MSERATMFNERDRRCTAVQLTLSNDPSYVSQNHRWIATNNRDVPMVMKTVSSYAYCLLCGFKWGPHHATSHLWSRLESQHQSVPGCAEKCGDHLVQSGGWWETLGVAAGLGAGPQDPRDPGLASEEVLRLCTLLSLAPLLPRPEPAGLLHLVIHRQHYQHDLPQHQSQPDLRHPPSIHRAPAGTCGTGMHPVQDPNRGGDWSWRRLYWIDVTSTT